MFLASGPDADPIILLSAKKGDEESGDSGDSERERETTPTSGTTDGIVQSYNEFPIDGGFQGWICVVGGFFALLASFGWLNCMGLFQTYYEQEILSNYSASSISWIFTVQLFLMWSGGALFGRIIDTYGTRYVAISCTLGCGFCIMMLSFATAYYQIMLTQGVGFGLFASGLYCCAVTSVGQWFNKRKALALGMVLAGSSLGGVVHALYLHFLIPKIGFPNAIRVNAGVIFAAGGISCVFMRTRLPNKKWGSGAKLVDLSLFKDKIFATYCIGTFLVVWGLFSTWAYVPTMSLRHNFSKYLAIYTIVVLNASSTLGRVVPAYLADRFGRFNSLSLIALLNAIVILGFWLPIEVSQYTTHAEVFALSAVAGFSTGACIGLFMPCAAELGPVEDLGSRFGLYQTVIGLGGLTGLPIQGALIPEDHGSFAHLIIFSGICIAAGSLIICGARMLKLGRTLRG